MPTCPGCGRVVTHRELETHVQYCGDLARRDPQRSPVEELDQELSRIERQLNRRMLKIEARLRHDDGDGHSRSGHGGGRHRYEE